MFRKAVSIFRADINSEEEEEEGGGGGRGGGGT